MKPNTRQQNTKIHPSKSFLKLIESNAINQYDKNDTSNKLTRARMGLKSALKTRKLADLMDTGKNNNISYHTHNRSLYPHDIQKSFHTGHNNLVESFLHSNTHSPSRSNSPNRTSKNKTQKMKLGGHESSKVIKIPSETDRKIIEGFTPKKVIESKHLQKELQKPQLQNFFSANNKREPQQAQESDLMSEKEHIYEGKNQIANGHKEKIIDIVQFEDSFHLIPLGKQDIASPTANARHMVNIVPIHTPVSSPEDIDIIGNADGIVIRDTAKERSKHNHKKILSHGNGIAMGREVVIVNSNESTKMERAILPTYNKSTTASHLNLNSQTSLRSKPHKVRNVSMNLSIEYSKPQLLGAELSGYNLNANSVRGNAEQLEARMQSILSNKRFNIEQIHEINGVFEDFANTFSDLDSRREAGNQQEMLRKIRLAYETFFQNYTRKEQSQLKKIIGEKNEVLAENRKLREELREYSDELRILRGAQSTKNLPSPTNAVSSLQFKKANHSPTPSEILNADKKNSTDLIDTPPITKNPIEADRERETLRSIISTQQQTINSFKKKEINISRILNACKMHGIDIKSICHEEIKAVLENNDNNHHHRHPSEEYDLPTLNKNCASFSKNLLRTKKNSIQKSDKTDREETNHVNSEPQSSRSMQDSATESDIKDQSSDNFIVDEKIDIRQQKQIDLNPLLKNKLKLDFTTLQNKNTNQPKIPGLKIKEVQMEAPIGFHEEFMARIDEFSLSWRQAAQKERKIP